jgi:hypothetical protein
MSFLGILNLVSIANSSFRPDAKVSASVYSTFGDISPLDHVLFFLATYGTDFVGSFLKRVAVSPESIDNVEFLFSVLASLCPSDSLALARGLYELRFFLQGPRCSAASCGHALPLKPICSSPAKSHLSGHSIRVLEKIYLR